MRQIAARNLSCHKVSDTLHWGHEATTSSQRSFPAICSVTLSSIASHSYLNHGHSNIQSLEGYQFLPSLQAHLSAAICNCMAASGPCSDSRCAQSDGPTVTTRAAFAQSEFLRLHTQHCRQSRDSLACHVKRWHKLIPQSIDKHCPAFYLKLLVVSCICEAEYYLGPIPEAHAVDAELVGICAGGHHLTTRTHAKAEDPTTSILLRILHEVRVRLGTSHLLDINNTYITGGVLAWLTPN